MGERVSFSPCGKYLASFNIAGKLRIWETETNLLKQEFTPASHLSSPCSSVSWVPVAYSPSKMKKKKRRLSGGRIQLLLVLGTDSGQIFFYSIAEGDVIASLHGHSRAVRNLTASAGTDLYSSAEKNIIQWDISEKSLKSKWKSTSYVNCMQVSEDNSILLTGLSSSIVCWNIENRTILKKFDGHKSHIIGLCLSVASSGEKYLFSAASEDRLVNVWNLNSTNHNRAVVMFSLPDVPCGISSNINSNGLVTFASVARTGSLHIYSHQLNGLCSKAIKPSTTVLVTADETTTTSKTELIPIISAKVLEKGLKIAFGSSPFISCENIDLNKNESELFLVRKDPRRSMKKKEESVNKVRRAETSGSIEYLSPATVNKVSLKRDREVINNEQKETMSSLLEKMNISSSKEHSSDGLAHLLIQGLNSQDRDILRSVLFTQNERRIKSTVERLPPQAVLPLLKIVNSLIQGKTWMSEIAAMWLQAILRTHVSQLLADESCASVITPLLGLVERRLTCLGPLCQLKGRLDLLLEQTALSTSTQPVVDVVPPLLLYQDIDSPANSNCLEEENDDNDGNEAADNDYDEEDDEKWTDLLNDMSAESDNDVESEDGSDNGGSDNQNGDEEMDTSS